ncbi:MAG: hypothetical protein ACTTKL_06580 [Treponema sp.]
MPDTRITVGMDASGLISGANAASASLETLNAKLHKAADAGNWREAAKIYQDIQNASQAQQMQAVMPNPSAYSQAAQSVAAAQNAAPQTVGNNAAGMYHGSAETANNAKRLDMRLEILTKTIAELTGQLEEAAEKGDSVAAANLSLALNNAEEDRRRLQTEQKQEKKEEKDEKTDKYGFAKFFTRGLQYAEQAAGIGFNYRTGIANGDYLGAGVNALDSASGVVQGIGNSLLGAGLTTGNAPLIIAGGAGELIGTIGKLIAGDKKADFAESDAYERSISHTNALNKLYVNGGTWQQNAMRTNRILSSGAAYADGTGLAAYDFIDRATQMSKFGAKSTDEAMRQAREAALFANATGTDIGAVQNYLGMARRYGDNSDVLGTVSQARQASGMTKAQNQEFLAALQSVIEDGIANGYVQSTKEAAETLTMFARLSDNDPLWQGQQGAERLRQMNSSIASATNLQTVSQVMTAQAAHTVLEGMNKEQQSAAIGRDASGTYIDTMLMLERGNNPALFGQIAKDIQSIEGNNFQAQVERYKDVFSLNYTGATQVYDMAQKMNAGEFSKEDFANAIEKMQKDKTYQSEETKKQDILNKLDTNVAAISQSEFWKSLKALEGVYAQRKSLIAVDANDTEEEKIAGLVSYAQENGKLQASFNNGSFSKQEDFFRSFAYEGIGDDKKDAAAAKLFAQYGVDTQKELMQVFDTIGSRKDGGVYEAYKGGNVDVFISKLGELLQKLNFTLTE